MPNRQPLSTTCKQLLLDLSPASPGITALECGRIMLGMGLAIGITALISQWVAHEQLELFWQGASISATAFLLFALPSSPLAQPWAILVGNISAGAIGMLCAFLFSNTVVAASIAVPLSVWAMMQLRAVHPPATAVALYMVLKHVQAPEILLFPLGFNLLVLVLVGTAFNRLTGRRYPYRQISSASNMTEADRGQVSQTDVDQALARYNEVLAISRDDLTSLLKVASGAAYKRHLGDLRCADVMTTNVQCAPANAPIEELRNLLGQSKHRELPVVDDDNRLLGAIGINQWFDVLSEIAEKNRLLAASANEPSKAASQAALKTAVGRAEQSTVQAAVPAWGKRLWRMVGLPRFQKQTAAENANNADNTKGADNALAATAAPAAPSVQALSAGQESLPRLVRDVMVPSLVIAQPQQPLMEITPILSQGGRYLIPVVDNKQHLQGIITQTDLLRALDRALPAPGDASAGPSTIP